MLPRTRPAEEAGRFKLLHEFFEAQADARPQAIALIIEGRRITYSELEQQANRLARYLHKQRVGPGSIVAILLPRSLNAYTAILGTIKAGAAYLPLDPEYPADRISYILRDSRVETLLTTASLASHHPGFHGSVIAVDADAGSIRSETHTVPDGRDRAGTG